MLAKALLTLLLAALVSAEVPSYIHVCGRRDPQLDQCILKSVAGMIDKLRQGIPELDVPPSEPLFIKEIDIADFGNFKASAKNIELYGISNYDVKYLHLDLDAKTIYLSANFKKIQLNADYNINTRIVVPVAGNGSIETTSNNIAANLTVKYKLIKRDNKEYLYFYSVTTKLTIIDFTAVFKDRSGTETSLATAINAALESTRQEIIESTRPNLEKTVSKMVLNVANKISQHFTYDELFPDRA